MYMCTLLTEMFCLMCNMQALYLAHNQIGDAGLSALAEAVGKGALAQCTYIGLSDNQIGDVGLTALASACASGALPALEELGLASNQIGDAGISYLAVTVGNGALDHLKNLYLGNNKCSQQSKDMLKTAMSKTNCSIHF